MGEQIGSGLTTAPGATLYERAGGAAGLRAVVDRFYAAVLADAELAPYFEGVDMARQRRHLALLVGQLLGGPRSYDGRDLATAHGHLHVTDAAYDRVVHHLGATLHDLAVPGDVIDTVGEALADVRAAIVRA